MRKKVGFRARFHRSRYRPVNEIWTWFEVRWGSQEPRESFWKAYIAQGHNLDGLSPDLDFAPRNVVFRNIPQHWGNILVEISGVLPLEISIIGCTEISAFERTSNQLHISFPPKSAHFLARRTRGLPFECYFSRSRMVEIICHQKYFNSRPIWLISGRIDRGTYLAGMGRYIDPQGVNLQWSLKVSPNPLLSNLLYHIHQEYRREY